jgi:hypothetical protein
MSNFKKFNYLYFIIHFNMLFIRLCFWDVRIWTKCIPNYCDWIVLSLKCVLVRDMFLRLVWYHHDIPFQGLAAFTFWKGIQRPQCFLFATMLHRAYFRHFSSNMQVYYKPINFLPIVCYALKCTAFLQYPWRFILLFTFAWMGVSTTIFHKCKFLLKPECTLHKTRLAWALVIQS